ncbi:MAG: hypothetical protein CMM57_02565, partial [Rhodospirillaceae bacterium]|nr:hypothetical protein [Rhodospirillaceae bacterium]
MVRYAIGQSVPRTEDPRLLKGVGRYLDDIRINRTVHGYILRATVAHARIKKIKTEHAAAEPGVLLILTGEDFVKSGLNGVVTDVGAPRRPDGKPIFRPPRPALVTDRIRCVGDQIAFILAETLDQAKDAAELIEIEYEMLPAMVGTSAAVGPNSIPVWEECPDNIAFCHDVGGSFGMKGGTYPEYVLVLWGAKLLDRPVKWHAPRSESF